MNLRQACQGAGTSKTALDLGWSQLSQTARTITTQWADQPERKPPTFELDALTHTVRHAWQIQKSLAGLSGREMRWLPHAMFHPEANRDVWLARDVAFTTAALSSIRERASAVRSLLRNVIRLWPKELAAAPKIQKMLAAQLRTATSTPLQEWRRRVEKYDLLSLDGPRKFADLMRAEPSRRTKLLEDAGLVGDLSQSAFLGEVNRCLADVLRENLTNQVYGDLEVSLELFAPDGRLTFQTQAPLYGDSLLLPFIEGTPPPQVKAKIQAFLLTHLKDPRLTQSGWVSVQPSARNVMLRWMVSASLDDFFTLIARHAQRDHWTYRKAFWAAYHKHDYISRAWVILGENAELEARRRWGQAIPAHGILRAGNPDHCVLLLHIGNVVIAEWSHNGTCRAWLENSEYCPRLYRDEYSRSELTANAGYEQRHAGNLYYAWQQQLAAVIHKTTGIGVTQTEYRVR